MSFFRINCSGENAAVEKSSVATFNNLTYSVVSNHSIRNKYDHVDISASVDLENCRWSAFSAEKQKICYRTRKSQKSSITMIILLMRLISSHAGTMTMTLLIQYLSDAFLYAVVKSWKIRQIYTSGARSSRSTRLDLLFSKVARFRSNWHNPIISSVSIQQFTGSIVLHTTTTFPM